MQSINKYPKYKPSGIPWLGEVPEHWQCNKLRSILSSVSKKNCPHLPLLSVVREKGVIVRNVSDDSENHNVIPEDLTNYKVVNPGQFAMNKMKAWQGSYGISKYEGIVSPAYFVFNLRNVEPSFFHVSMRSKVFIPFFAAASDGIRVGQWDLSMSRMREILFFVPSKTEQLQIARFLDWKIGQINKFIKAKKQIIELLKEQKQAIINDAVTGKIDVRTGKPYTKYKPSGVEWLGDIPEEWEVRKLRNILTPISSKNRSDLPLLSVVREKGIILRNSMTDEENHNFIPDDLSGYKVVEKGQFAMNKMKAWQGSYGISQYNGIVSPAYFVFNVNFQNSDFFNIAIRSKNYIKFFAQASDGIRIGQWDLSLQRMKEIPFIVPPLETQEIISNYIPNILQTIEKSINNNIKEILLVQEYKDRFIADVVTGKVDVRDIEVPEVIEDIEEEILKEENEELEEMEGEIDSE